MKDAPSNDEKGCLIRKTCCNRFLAEWRLGMYSLEEPSGKIIDLEKLFRPCPFRLWGIVKFGLFAWTMEVIIQSIVTSIEPNMWMAFLTNWQALIVLAYISASLLVHANVIPVSENEKGQVNIWTRLTWTLYTLSLSLSLFTAIMFWCLVYRPGDGIEYIMVMPHGGLFVFVLLDGMFINRIPIRLRQLVWLEGLGVLFMLWTMIYAFSTSDNPIRSDEDPATDDDALYGVLNWEKRTMGAVILCAIIFFVGFPFLFHCLWLFSLLFKPKYKESDKNGKEKKESWDDSV